MNLYNLKAVEPGHYMIAKFDSDFNIAATYNLRAKGTGWTCDCPAGQRSIKLKPCKHQRAMPAMLAAANTERFYDIDTRTWHEPLKDTTLEHADMQPQAVGITSISEQEVIDISGEIAKEIHAELSVGRQQSTPSKPIVTRRI